MSTAIATNNALPSGDLLAAMNPKAATAADTAAAAQDRFMLLLVTQMKNQDPLNPMDNAQVTSQMAQLSTVTGVNKLNDTMKSLMQSVQGGQAMQAASLIGRSVLVPGSSLSLSEGKSAFGAELTQPVDSLQLTISDGAGNPVRVMNLGPQEPGTLTLGWDGSNSSGGTAPDGRYQLQLSGISAGQKVTVQPLSFAQVSSVSTGMGGVSLNLNASASGGRTAVSMADVRQIH